MLNYISYGGGVQSTAMVLMALDGVIERPDMVVFADTGSEMPQTYHTVSKIEQICKENNLPFYTTKSETKSIEGKSLHDWYMEKKSIPMIGIRWCTGNFKVQPVRSFVKQFADKTKPKPWLNAWLGITSDERRRARLKSDVKFETISYPILHITREECKTYISKNYPDLEVAKSGCFCCPYADKHHWINLKKNYSYLFDLALTMEKNARKGKGHKTKRGLYNCKSIEIFNYSHQLTDFGFEIAENETCDSWSCFT
jgi:3'-phosphoadenosine 5'-phosphosulfate sulfotransferase (PAPS reductase)/FAD synthetase